MLDRALARRWRPSSSARSRSSSPAAARSWSTRRPAQLGHVGVAITFGLVIMAMIYAVGHISGAHFNPAVSFAFALSRHFPWPRAFAYWAAQLARRAHRGGDPARLARQHRPRRRHAPVRLAGPVVPLGARDELLPDVRDHGRRDRHAGGRGGGGDRDRRHGRPRRDVRRPDLGRLDEPGPLDRPGDRQRRPARALALHRSRRSSAPRSARSPTSSSASEPSLVGIDAASEPGQKREEEFV